jgi:putative hydrolase of the HAD superfamily
MTRSAHPRRATPVRAVVFDLDDTLYLERDYARSGLLAVGTYLHSHGGPEGVGEWMWQQFQDGRRTDLFNAADQHFRLGFEPIHVADLVEYYRNHRPGIRPIPAAQDLLDRLRGTVKLGLLSDGFLPAQRYKLEALGLVEYFDAVLFTEAIGRQYWKPSTVPFERIAKELAEPPAACAYVGDNPSKDFLGANQLGWRTVQWLQDGQVHTDKPTPAGGEPRHVVRTADELRAVLGLDR